MDIESVPSLIVQLYENRTQQSHLRTQEKALRETILLLIGSQDVFVCPEHGLTATAFVHERRAVSLERLRAEYPDVAEICTELTAHRRIEIHRHFPKKEPVYL